MKRNIFLATAAAVTLIAGTAMAQPYGGGRNNRRPVPAPAPHIQMPSVSSFGPHAAQAGASVTIYGQGFSRGTMVQLGGQMITPSFVGAGRVTFKVPARAADGRLSLVIPGHRRALAVGAFDVVAPVRVAPRPGRYDDSGWTRTRNNRRASSRRTILSRWNNRRFLASPAARAELSVHARRLAQLNRMARLARGTGKYGLTARINRAISRENARHDRKMKQLESSFLASYRPGRF